MTRSTLSLTLIILGESVTLFCKLFFAFQGVTQLAITLTDEKEDHIKAATAWSLGQIGRHTPEHAKAVAVANVLPRLLQLYLSTTSSEDLQTKVLLIMLQRYRL